MLNVCPLEVVRRALIKGDRSSFCDDLSTLLEHAHLDVQVTGWFQCFGHEVEANFVVVVGECIAVLVEVDSKSEERAKRGKQQQQKAEALRKLHDLINAKDHFHIR